MTFTNSESVILADVVASLGHKLVKNPHLSSVSCLTCARTLTRVYGMFAKLVSNSNEVLPFQSQSRTVERREENGNLHVYNAIT